MKKVKRLVFLSGTRADFGKLKALIRACERVRDYDVHIFATGMHLHRVYGMTIKEIKKSNFKQIHPYINGAADLPMDLSLAKTIEGFSYFVKELEPQLIVVHGDRKETLAGAIVGALNNILVAHIEGGEISGTVDELIRHSVSKLAHIHFVANDKACARLLQLGERRESIFVIGSPDIDIMCASHLPSLRVTRQRYDIPFEEYNIVLFHPVTTEHEQMKRWAPMLVKALLSDMKRAGSQYIVLLPNDDLGSQAIIEAYERLWGHPQVRIFPSLRFENFLTLLKHARCIIGNSSAGIREAPVYGVPAINIGSRQRGRAEEEGSIFSCTYTMGSILKAIGAARKAKFSPSYRFGAGKSQQLFMRALRSQQLWEIAIQKQFVDRTAG